MHFTLYLFSCFLYILVSIQFFEEGVCRWMFLEHTIFFPLVGGLGQERRQVFIAPQTRSAVGAWHAHSSTRCHTCTLSFTRSQAASLLWGMYESYTGPHR